MTVPEPDSTPPSTNDWSMQSPPECIYSVMAHLDWPSRAQLPFLSKSWTSELIGKHRSAFFWRFMCLRLAREQLLYVSPSLLDYSTITCWKSKFEEMWQMRERFHPVRCTGPRRSFLPALAESAARELEDEDLAETEESKQFRFTVDVCVRFKPESAGEAEKQNAKVHLPLHQMLGVIRAKNKKRNPWGCAEAVVPASECTPREEEDTATSQTTTTTTPATPLPTPSEATEEPEASPASSLDSEESADNKLDERLEIDGKLETGVLNVNEERSSVLVVAPTVGLRSFSFNRVFSCEAKQPEVYQQAQSLVMDFMNGFNGSVLMYGQTGSGKTHTMFGEPGDSREEGIVPRACAEVLHAVKHRREHLGITAELAVSFVEVYGNEVTDLLRGGRPVGQSRVAGQRYVLDGHAEIGVENAEDVRVLLETGEAQKRRAATAMNDRSSRAHSIFVLSLRQLAPGSDVAVESRLLLADLGGCEKLIKSKADEGTAAAGSVPWAQYYEQRRRLQEATHINVGLFALKKCIDALNNRQEAIKEGKPLPYVPYQDSKLTMLLSTALGGTARTCVIVTAAMDKEHASETMQALRFGEHCARVENSATISSAALVKALKSLDDEISTCEATIQKQERWQNVVTTRKDMEGEERIVTSKLVGAEAEREQLQGLLSRRRALLGQA